MIADYAYDLVNHVNTVAYRNGLTNRTDYDPLGRAMQVRVIDDTSDIVDYRYGYDAEGNVTHYEYNALGSQAAVIDANNVRTSYLYDDLNRLIGVIENYTDGESTNDSNVLTQYLYDALGNRIVITNARNYSSTYTVYDALNRAVIVRDGLGHETHTRYNALGNRTVVTDADGGVTYYGYDGLNRLVSIQYPEFTVQYAYNAVGSRTMMTDSVGVTTYVYDDLSRPVSVDDPITDTVEYDYDLAGNRTQLIYPSGQVVTYTYDADNRLIQVEDWDEGLTTYEYDAAGRLTATELPNGVVTVNEYDDAGWLVNLTHTDTNDVLLSSYSYRLNNVDNRTQVTETLDGTTRVIDYVYDPLNRLVSADYSTGESFEYAYDTVGNRTTMTTTAGTNSYQYDRANRLTSVDDVGYTWDDRGNLVDDGTFTYTYNTAGRMVRAESITVTLVYTYNADGLRVAQSVDGDVTSFVWDWASGLPEMLSDGDNLYLVGHGTSGQSVNDEWVYYLPDALGSIRQETNATGAVTSSREWTPFGVEIGTVQGGLGYTGEWLDSYVEFNYLRARWYVPYLDRFTSPDTIVPDFRNPQSMNNYTYVLGNPVGFIDPSGHERVDPTRAQMLKNYGSALLDNNAWDAMSRFVEFASFAGSLYDDGSETTQYMLDMTAVIHGYEHDSDSEESFWPHFDERTSPFWLGEGAFDRYYNPNDSFHCLQPGMCDRGWNAKYKDDSGNQAFHFWFYVAVAYFDGEAWSHKANFYHDGAGTTQGKICNEGIDFWNFVLEIVYNPPPQIPLLQTGDGVSEEDYALGLRGTELGKQLAIWDVVANDPIFQLYGATQYQSGYGVRPTQVAAWIQENLAE